MNIRSLLENYVSQAMIDANIPEKFTASVIASKSRKFGDYQANGAMAAAKALKTNPRSLAQKMCDAIQAKGLLHDIAEKVDVAGPGFINIHLNRTWLSKQLHLAANDERLSVERKKQSERVVLDYSSPNLAKEMHIGHIRSTVIGDAIARIREFQGDTVIRQNHVGDWGTQFGMLIAELEDQLGSGSSAELALNDLEIFYQRAKKHFDNDPQFADRARNYVVKLQSGDKDITALWQRFRGVSLRHAEDIYKILNITLRPEHVYGESAYNDDLPILVNELKANGLAVEDKGALVVFLTELADKQGNPSVMIIQKKDGGYLYSTTDLAGMRYRTQQLKASRIELFIDDRQSLHMKQIFALAKKAGFVGDELAFEHRAFGKILGKDGKPFKTRSGGTVKLMDVLHEAIDKALNVVSEKNPNLSEQATRAVAQKVGIGAVKYAELSKTRTNDYIFDLDAMLSFDGNTGPYLQYAYTRIASIFKKAELDLNQFSATISLKTDQEQALCLKLLRLSEVVEHVEQDAYPHILCTYLYELASLFMTFYEACPILKDDVKEEDKLSRLQLSKATARTIALGLDLLGIEVMEKM